MDKNEYTVKVRLEDGRYATLSVKGRMAWRTKAIAQHHAYEYKAKNMRDSWVENANVADGKCYAGRRMKKRKRG